MIRRLTDPDHGPAHLFNKIPHAGIVKAANHEGRVIVG